MMKSLFSLLTFTTLCLSFMAGCQRLTNDSDALEIKCKISKPDSQAILAIEDYRAYSNAKAWAVNSRAEARPLMISDTGCIGLENGDSEEKIIVRAERMNGRYGLIVDSDALTPDSLHDLALAEMPVFLPNLEICSREGTYLNSLPHHFDIPRGQLPSEFSLSVSVTPENQPSSPPQILTGSESDTQRLFSIQDAPQGEQNYDFDIRDMLEPDRSGVSKRVRCRIVVDTLKPTAKAVTADGKELTDKLYLNPGEMLKIVGSESIRAEYCFVSKDDRNLRLCGATQDGGLIAAPVKGRWSLELNSVDQARNTRSETFPIMVYDVRTVELVKELAKDSMQGFSQEHALKALEAENIRRELGTEEEKREVLNLTKAALLSALTRTQEVQRFPVTGSSIRFHVNSASGRIVTWDDISHLSTSCSLDEQVRLWSPEGVPLLKIGSGDRCPKEVFVAQKSSEVIVFDDHGILTIADIATLETKTLDLLQKPYEDRLIGGTFSKFVFMEEDRTLLYYEAEESRYPGLIKEFRTITVNLNDNTVTKSTRQDLPTEGLPWELFDALGSQVYLTNNSEIQTCTRDLAHCQKFAMPDEMVFGNYKLGKASRNIYASASGRIYVWQADKPDTQPRAIPGQDVFEISELGKVIIQDGSKVRLLDAKDFKSSGETVTSPLPLIDVIYDNTRGEIILVDELGFFRLSSMRVLERLTASNLGWEQVALGDKGDLFALHGEMVSRYRFAPRRLSDGWSYDFGKGKSTLSKSLPGQLVFSTVDGIKKVYTVGEFSSISPSPRGTLVTVMPGGRGGGKVHIFSQDGLVHTMAQEGVPMELHINPSESFGVARFENGIVEVFSTQNTFKPFTMQFTDWFEVHGLAIDSPRFLLRSDSKIQIVDAAHRDRSQVIVEDDTLVDYNDVEVSKDFSIFTITFEGTASIPARTQVWKWDGSMIAEHKADKKLFAHFPENCPFLFIKPYNAEKAILVDGTTHETRAVDSVAIHCSPGSSVFVALKNDQTILMDRDFNPLQSFPAGKVVIRKSGFYLESRTEKLLRSVDEVGRVIEAPFHDHLGLERDEKLKFSSSQTGVREEWLIDKDLERFPIPAQRPGEFRRIGLFAAKGCFLWSMDLNRDLDLPCKDKQAMEIDGVTRWINGIEWPMDNVSLRTRLENLLVEKDHGL